MSVQPVIVEYLRRAKPRLTVRYRRAHQHHIGGYQAVEHYMRKVIARNIRYVVYPDFDEWRRK